MLLDSKDGIAIKLYPLDKKYSYTISHEGELFLFMKNQVYIFFNVKSENSIKEMHNISKIKFDNIFENSPLLEVIQDFEDRTNKLLLVIADSYIYVISLKLEKILGKLRLQFQRSYPIVWIENEYINILGGKSNKNVYEICERINLRYFFRFELKDIPSKIFKVVYNNWTISKSSIKKGGVVITPKGTFIIGRKQKKILFVAMIDANEQTVFLDYSEKTNAQEIYLCNSNCFLFNNYIGYLFATNKKDQFQARRIMLEN